MRKIISTLLIFAITALLCSALASCKKDGYKPVESTAEEKKVVMTLTLEGKSYDVKYELYRALFLSLKSEVDGGDTSVWSGENKDEYVKKIDTLILERAAKIYAAFAVCEKIGIDVYSKEFEERINDYITLSVDGGYANSIKYEGFGGDYEKYLASLKAMNLNYSVQVLLLRYSIALEKIELHYAGNINDAEFLPDAVLGAIKYTPDTIRDFYYSDECVRVIRVFLNSNFTPTRVKEIRDTLAQKSGEDDVVSYAIQFTTTGAADVRRGEIIGKYNLDSTYYGELVDAAFSLNTFEVSEPVLVITGQDDGYHILYKTIKLDENFDECYSDIVRVYLQNEVGKILAEGTAALAEGVEYSGTYSTLNHADISMD